MFIRSGVIINFLKYIRKTAIFCKFSNLIINKEFPSGFLKKAFSNFIYWNKINTIKIFRLVTKP